MTRPGTTTARGYGWTHQKLRSRLLADLAANPGQPCPKCGHPMYAEQNPDLGHTDDRTGYTGLEHRHCNRLHGSRKGHQRRRLTRQPPTPSRNW